MKKRLFFLLATLFVLINGVVSAQTFSESQLSGVKIGQCAPLKAEIESVTRIGETVTFVFNITNPTQYQIPDLRMVSPTSISKGPQNQVTVVTGSNKKNFMNVGIEFDGNNSGGSGKVNGSLPAGATKQVAVTVNNVGPEVEYLTFKIGAWTYPRNGLQSTGWTFDKVPVPNQDY